MVFEDWHDLSSFARSKNHIQREVACHATALDVSRGALLYGMCTNPLDAFPKLRELRISLSSFTITPGDEVLLPWLDDLSDVDLIQCGALKDLMQLRGLRKLEIKKSGRSNLTDPEEIARLAKHLDRAETLIRQESAKPRPVSLQCDYPMGISRALSLTSDTRQLSHGHALVEEARAERGPALTDDDVPQTPDGLVGLFLSRPQDVLAWVRDVDKRVTSREGERVSVERCRP